MAAKRRGHAKVIFDDLAFTEDIEGGSANGRAVARATRHAYERHGCPVNELLACQDEATDETRLPGCVKVYLPRPAGRFGMVFEIDRRASRLVLAYLAFGVRHHPPGSHAPTVYRMAHRRLHCQSRLRS